MPRESWTPSNERQYKVIFKQCRLNKRKKTLECQRVAAATVNKKRKKRKKRKK